MSEPPQTQTLFNDSTTPLCGRRAEVPVLDLGPGQVDLRALLHRRPELASDHSFVIETAAKEYRELLAHKPSMRPMEYCELLGDLPASLVDSVYKQLEVEHYFETKQVMRMLLGLRVGDRVGSFVVQEELGKGGLAHVYLCAQPELGHRQVVVKTGLLAEEEAHTLGQLRHANIVPVLSIERHPLAEASLICMPFLGRSTLYDLLTLVRKSNRPASEHLRHAARHLLKLTDEFTTLAGPGPPTGWSYVDCILYIGCKLAQALQHAHEVGIIHGDLKPSNVLLSPLGEPLLTDFNLSGNRQLAIAPQGGTVPYMAPEQLRAHFQLEERLGPVDARSDVFSWGVLMYELLCGETPFGPRDKELKQEELVKEILRRQQQGCQPLRSTGRAIPRALAVIVEKCLAVDARARFATAGELAEQLRKEMRPTKVFVRRALQRPRRLAAIGGGLLMMVLAGVAWSASLPPKHERYFSRGLQLARQNEDAAALDSFKLAIADRPEFANAHLEVGKLAIKRKDWSAASTSFGKVANELHDPRGAAYNGYTYCQQRKFGHAIPWFQKALEGGVESGAIHNDLAVAHELGNQFMSEAERLEQVRFHLLKAIDAIPHSSTVQFNWVLYELRVAQTTNEALSQRALDYVQELARTYPTSRAVQQAAAFSVVSSFPNDPQRMEQAVVYLANAIRFGAQLDLESLTRKLRWAPLRRSPAFAKLLESSATPRAPLPAGPAPPRLLSLDADFN